MNVKIIEAIKALWDTNKATVVALITQGEGGAEAFILSALKAEGARLTGLAAMLDSFVEPQLAAYVQAEFTQYGPQYLYTFIDAWLAGEIKTLGG